MDNEYDELIDLAINKQPIKFQSAIDDIFKEKIANRVDALRQDVAQNYFNPPDPDELEDEIEDIDIDDDDFSEEELEDLEIPEDDNEE